MLHAEIRLAILREKLSALETANTNARNGADLNRRRKSGKSGAIHPGNLYGQFITRLNNWRVTRHRFARVDEDVFRRSG